MAKGESSQQSAHPPRTVRAEQPAPSLQARLERKLAAARKYRSVIRFFENHRSLFSSSEHREIASAKLRRARVRLARVTKTIAALRRGDRAARAATTCQGSAEGRDLQRLRPALLRPGAQGLVVRVPTLDKGPERPVPRSLPDGLERTSPVRSRRNCAPAGTRRSQVLRGLGTRLEPVELQAGLRLLLTPRSFRRKLRMRTPIAGFLSRAVLLGPRLCGDNGNETVCERSTRRPRMRVVTATAMRTSGSSSFPLGGRDTKTCSRAARRSGAGSRIDSTRASPSPPSSICQLRFRYPTALGPFV